MRFTDILFISLLLNIKSSRAQFCGPWEERCPADYCVDLSCDGVAIASSQNGKCRCKAGRIRNRQHRVCERPGPNCVGRGRNPAASTSVVVSHTPPHTNSIEDNAVAPYPICHPLNQVRYGRECLYRVAPGSTCVTVGQCLGGSLCDRGYCTCPQGSRIHNGRCITGTRSGATPLIGNTDAVSVVGGTGEARRDMLRGDDVPSIFQLCLDDHFYTASQPEVSRAGADGYTFEGPIGRIVTYAGNIPNPSPCEGLVPLYRYWYTWFQFDHFYTIHKTQGNKAVAGLYADEGIAGYCVKDTPSCGSIVPLHRFWSSSTQDHIYITKQSDFQRLQRDLGWSYEGVECYIWPT